MSSWRCVLRRCNLDCWFANRLGPLSAPWNVKPSLKGLSWCWPWRTWTYRFCMVLYQICTTTLNTFYMFLKHSTLCPSWSVRTTPSTPLARWASRCPEQLRSNSHPLRLHSSEHIWASATCLTILTGLNTNFLPVIADSPWGYRQCFKLEWAWLDGADSKQGYAQCQMATAPAWMRSVSSILTSPCALDELCVWLGLQVST